jgi:hypothetical protein
MGTTVRTFHVCDRCSRDVVRIGKVSGLPDGWMEVRGEMWNTYGDSMGVQFYALLCSDCRHELNDWRDSKVNR